MEHRRSEQRKPSPKRRAQEIISREHRRRILRVRMRLVAENAIENETTTDTEQHGRNDRHDPVHGGELARPAEPEERDGESEASNAGRWELHFGSNVPVLVEVFGLVFPFPPEVAGDGDAAG